MIKYSCFILTLHLFATCTLAAMDNDRIGNLENLPDEVLGYYSLLTCNKTLFGHKDSISCVTVTGDYIVSGSHDRTIKIWDLKTGTCIKTLTGHTSWVNCITLAGNNIVSGSSDNTIKFWNLETGKCIKTLTGHKTLFGHEESVRCIAIDRDYIVSGSDDNINIWNQETGTCIKTLTGHTNWVKCIAIAGDYIISGSEDGTIKIWYARWLNLFPACPCAII